MLKLIVTKDVPMLETVRNIPEMDQAAEVTVYVHFLNQK